MSQSTSTGATGPAPTAPTPAVPGYVADIESDAGSFWTKVKAYFSGSVIATAIGAGVAGFLVGHFF